ncbi:MAG: ARMT1-like domain-containing protein [Lachnospiraceae bacterium]|nr:ARMT1-like domain-containing protein [Lachnospiraceae bacterium]
MKISKRCIDCLYKRQMDRSNNDKEYMEIVDEIFANRDESDCCPYLVYQFNKEYEKRYGKAKSFRDINRKYNDIVLEREDKIRTIIEKSEEPLKKALMYSRVGNYIDFGGMNVVDDDELFRLLNDVETRKEDEQVIESFFSQCENAENFLLLADNCGEIVLDKLLIEQLKRYYPKLNVTVMVRGGEIYNDALLEDALYIGIDKVAKVITNGTSIAGTVYKTLPDEAKQAIDNADVILSKGQANYESFAEEGFHAFFSLLCKCEMFVERFNVPRLTGIFVEKD